MRRRKFKTKFSDHNFNIMFSKNLFLMVLAITMTAASSKKMQQQLYGADNISNFGQKRSENKVDAETMALLKIAYLVDFYMSNT